MTGDAFEYAIKKDVRNNPIVREVDRDRHRDLWRTIVVGVSFVAVVMFSASRRLGPVHYGYLQDQLLDELAFAKLTHDQLSIERDTLRSPANIERLAREKLHMIVPGDDEHEVIPRVTTDSPPPRTSVARREP